jgi:uncharacterized protein (TIGR02611 family)
MGEPRRGSVDVRAVARFLIRSTRRAVITLVGLVLLCLGIAGLLLPVLPGWVLIIGGFAVWSREYSWAHSCLGFCRRQAAKNGSKLKAMAARRRARSADAGREVVLPSDDVVIDLTAVQSDRSTATESTSSQAL